MYNLGAENDQKDLMEESTLFVTEESPIHTDPFQVEATMSSPVYIIIFTCAITIVVTMIVILLIVPRVSLLSTLWCTWF